ncbi:MAG TPA: hypothetical protein VGS60_03785, partial [Actinomycetes bacterium]|nr:hypothetical protein [Actinomycetes bacterium]
LEIQRMRDEWLHQARGSLRDFHDLLAGTGRLPISLVDSYLAETAPTASEGSVGDRESGKA